MHEGRELALRACRAVIQASGKSIRAVHRHEDALAAERAAEAGAALGEAHRALADYPVIAGAGFLHDAEKEFAEARLLVAIISGGDVPGHGELGIGPAAWLNGLCEAASELRRHLLDVLRAGDQARAESLLDAMDEVYAVLVGVDFPDAVTGGLRRSTDALRAVLERTRSDLTTTVLQARLQRVIEDRLSTD